MKRKIIAIYRKKTCVLLNKQGKKRIYELNILLLLVMWRHDKPVKLIMRRLFVGVFFLYVSVSVRYLWSLFLVQYMKKGCNKVADGLMGKFSGK